MSSSCGNTNPFCLLSDDVVLNIFEKLEGDPRNWARLACVCTKFRLLIRDVCIKNKCFQAIPFIVSDLLSSANPLYPPDSSWWVSLYNISVACPGLLHAGVLLQYSDFGLERSLGCSENFHELGSSQFASSSLNHVQAEEATASSLWSMSGDVYFDTARNVSELSSSNAMDISNVIDGGNEEKIDRAVSVKRPKHCCDRSVRGHLASGTWSLSREEGNKLLASRFRVDCLYICDWPGCVHSEAKRNYQLFRGVFKNFKQSMVWRMIGERNRRSRIDIGCAFCECKETWDLHSAFCLRRFYGYHNDGEPVVRAYVCENGHVSGVWTDLELYN